MKRERIHRVFGWVIRLGLFGLILGGGTLAALAVDETTSLALADLPDTSIEAVATTPDGSTLYAVLDNQPQVNGFYRSQDQGRTWEVVEADLDLTAINALAVDPDNAFILYAGTEGGPLGVTNNVWRSQDGGESWQNFNLSLPANPDGIVPAVTAIVPDPNQPGVLYVGTDGQGVYRFDKNQLGYELVGGTSMATVHVRDLLVDDNSRLYALTNNGLFTFETDVWRPVDSLPGITVSLAVVPLNPQILYVSVPPSGVFRSMDGGQTWKQVVQGLGWGPGVRLRATALAVDATNPGHVVAATAYGLGRHHLSPGGIYETQTGGENWTKIADTNRLITQLTFTPSGILAATEAGFKQYPVSSLAEEVSGQPSLTGPVVNKLNSLLPLSGIQILVLVLTLSLAGLALLGRLTWFRRQRKAIPVYKSRWHHQS